MKRICILYFLVISVSISAQSKAELEAQKERTLKELQTSKELLGATSRKKSVSLQRLEIISATIRSRENMISNINKELKLLTTRIDTLQERVDKLDELISIGKSEYEHIIISIYKNHTDEEKIMYLLASNSLNQFYQRIKYLKYLNDYRENKVKELQNLIIDLNESKELLEGRIEEKEALLSEKEKEARDLAGEKERRAEMVQELSREESVLRKRIKEKERISNQLDTRINEMIEAEARKASANNLFNSLTPEQKLLGSSFENNKGRLPWPVDRGVITTKFGLINHPVLSGVKISNNGVDISSIEGTKARAIFDGEVTGISAILGANYVVLIMHGEFISVYQNLVDLKVKIGDKVVAKQEIGTIHSDPEEHMAVMHLQIRKQREALDPELWLSK